MYQVFSPFGDYFIFSFHLWPVIDCVLFHLWVKPSNNTNSVSSIFSVW
eukprot:UN09552